MKAKTMLKNYMGLVSGSKLRETNKLGGLVGKANDKLLKKSNALIDKLNPDVISINGKKIDKDMIQRQVDQIQARIKGNTDSFNAAKKRVSRNTALARGGTAAVLGGVGGAGAYSLTHRNKEASLYLDAIEKAAAINMQPVTNMVTKVGKGLKSYGNLLTGKTLDRAGEAYRKAAAIPQLKPTSEKNFAKANQLLTKAEHATDMARLGTGAGVAGLATGAVLAGRHKEAALYSDAIEKVALSKSDLADAFSGLKGRSVKNRDHDTKGKFIRDYAKPNIKRALATGAASSVLGAALSPVGRKLSDEFISGNPRALTKMIGINAALAGVGAGITQAQRSHALKSLANKYDVKLTKSDRRNNTLNPFTTPELIIQKKRRMGGN